jgi:hypothetical protein
MSTALPFGIGIPQGVVRLKEKHGSRLGLPVMVQTGIIVDDVVDDGNVVEGVLASCATETRQQYAEVVLSRE